MERGGVAGVDGCAARARDAEALVATGRRAEPARRRKRSAQPAPESGGRRGSDGGPGAPGAGGPEEATAHEARPRRETGAPGFEAAAQREEAGAALAGGLDARR